MNKINKIILLSKNQPERILRMGFQQNNLIKKTIF